MKRIVIGLLCVLLVLSALPPARAATGGFSDVPAGSWYAETVGAMTQAGWLKGYPDGTFRPQAKISAAEFVSIVARCANLPLPQQLRPLGGGPASGRAGSGLV